MLVKTLLPFVLAALAVNARPVLPTEKTPADAKDAVFATAGGHGHGTPFEGVHFPNPPTGQRRDVPEPPVKPEGVENTRFDQAIPFGQAPVPHDRMPKKAPLPASPPSTPADGVASRVASRGFVSKPAVLDDVDPMSERSSAMGVEHGVAQNAQAAPAEVVPVGTRDVKTPVPAPDAPNAPNTPNASTPVSPPAANAPAAPVSPPTEVVPVGTRDIKTPVPAPNAPNAPTPGSAPAAPVSPPAAKAPAPASAAPAPPAPVSDVKDVVDNKAHAENKSNSDSDSDNNSNSNANGVFIRVKGPRALPVSKPSTPVTDAVPVKENMLPVRDEAPKVPSAVTDKAQMVSSTLPHAVPRRVEAPEVKHTSPNPQDVPSVSPKEETPTVTAPPEERPTVPASASDVQPTTVTSKVSDVPSAPTNDVKRF